MLSSVCFTEKIQYTHTHMRTHCTGWSPWLRVQTKNYFWKSQKNHFYERKIEKQNTVFYWDYMLGSVTYWNIFDKFNHPEMEKFVTVSYFIGLPESSPLFLYQVRMNTLFCAMIYGKAKRSLWLVKIAALRQTVTGHRSPTHRLFWGLNWNEKCPRNCEFLNVSSTELLSFLSINNFFFLLIF